MIKFYQLDKVIIIFPRHMPWCPKADASAENLPALTDHLYVDGKQVMLSHCVWLRNSPLYAERADFT